MTQRFLCLDHDTVNRQLDRERAIATRNAAAGEALSHMRFNKRLRRVLETLAASLPGGMTRSEVAWTVPCGQTGVSQAFSDALDARLVETTGERRMSSSGVKVDVYRITQRGLDQLTKRIEKEIEQQRCGKRKAK
jgi:hypothetical protein